MKINLESVREKISLQKERNIREKGYQPEMTLSCFSDNNREFTEVICENCRDYEITCKSFLNPYKIK